MAGSSNTVDISLEELVNLKVGPKCARRLSQNSTVYTITSNGRILTIVGNPDLGSVKTVMLGIKNPLRGDANNPLPQS
jgi:cell surface protein SprA